MPELRLQLDPANPGQFYACCGLFEIAAGWAPLAGAQFVCSEERPRQAEFAIAGDGIPGLAVLLGSVSEAVPEPIPVNERSVYPMRLLIGGRTHELDWWLDEFRLETTNLKCWAGQVTTGKLFEELPALIEPEKAAAAPLSFPAMTKSKFGVDPRSAWNALDFGYSPNVHNQDAAGYPVVEVLAAIGLQGFRPGASSRSDIRYSLWTVPLPLAVARTAAVAPWNGLPRFDYTFDIAKRGQSYKFFTFAKFDERKA
jgi:CRISPR-associated protein Csx14